MNFFNKNEYNLNMKVITNKIVLIIELLMSFFAVIFMMINLLCPYNYKMLIKKYSVEYMVEPSLVASIIYVESKFNKNAKSDKNACGLMQILPNTAKSFYFKEGEFNLDLLFNAKVNIEIGVRFLSYLFNKYKDELTVLACYNAGEKNVLDWKGDDLFLEKTQIMFNETKNYINKVQKMKNIYKLLLN